MELGIIIDNGKFPLYGRTVAKTSLFAMLMVCS